MAQVAVLFGLFYNLIHVYEGHLSGRGGGSPPGQDNTLQRQQWGRIVNTNRRSLYTSVPQVNCIIKTVETHEYIELYNTDSLITSVHQAT